MIDIGAWLHAEIIGIAGLAVIALLLAFGAGWVFGRRR